MTYSIGGTVIIQANAHINYAQLIAVPTMYNGVAARRTVGSGSFQFQGIETTGTSIRAISYN